MRIDSKQAEQFARLPRKRERKRRWSISIGVIFIINWRWVRREWACTWYSMFFDAWFLQFLEYERNKFPLSQQIEVDVGVCLWVGKWVKLSLLLHSCCAVAGSFRILLNVYLLSQFAFAPQFSSNWAINKGNLFGVYCWLSWFISPEIMSIPEYIQFLGNFFHVFKQSIINLS